MAHDDFAFGNDEEVLTELVARFWEAGGTWGGGTVCQAGEGRESDRQSIGWEEAGCQESVQEVSGREFGLS